ncbi:MAG: hypothetical protein ACR2IE_18500 [Candidatus Sumerlaeaceae bacterium]
MNLLSILFLIAIHTAARSPVETRLGSPFGGIVVVRQEQQLKLNVSLHRKADSQDATWHVGGLRSDVLGQISVDQDSPLQCFSNALKLPCNPGFTRMQYDPWRATAHYLDGKIRVHVLADRALIVESSKRPLRVSLQKELSQTSDSIWYAAREVNGQPLYCGLIFDNPATPAHIKARDGNSTLSVCTRRFAVVWGDSLQQLSAVAHRTRHWHESLDRTRTALKTVTAPAQLTGDVPTCRQNEMNKRALASMQYDAGGVFAALDGGYTDIWNRDAAIACVFPALAGATDYLKRWTPYVLANAKPVSTQGRDYHAFLTFPSHPPDQSWQQDGSFYAVLSVYAFWKLTGDETHLSQWYAKLADSIDFLRATAYDPSDQLYWETYINEAFLKGAHNFREVFPTMRVGDKWPLHIKTLYINHLLYGAHLMMTEMAEHLGRSAEADLNWHRAQETAHAVNQFLWLDKDQKHHAGIASFEDGTTATIDWNYWDIYFDYVWALTLYPFTPDADKSLKSLDAMLHREGVFPGTDKRLYFAPAWVHASAGYAQEGQYENAWTCLDRLTRRAADVGYSTELKAIYQMKYAMPERMDNFALHRPQTFGAGPHMHASSCFVLTSNYNGVSMATGGHLTGAKNIHVRDCMLNVDSVAPANPAGLIVDGKEIPFTLRVPSRVLTPGTHNLSFLGCNQPTTAPLLLHAPFELLDVHVSAEAVQYDFKGYGNGAIRFADVAREAVSIQDSDGHTMPFKYWNAKGGTRIETTARGRFSLNVPNALTNSNVPEFQPQSKLIKTNQADCQPKCNGRGA